MGDALAGPLLRHGRTRRDGHGCGVELGPAVADPDVGGDHVPVSPVDSRVVVVRRSPADVRLGESLVDREVILVGDRFLAAPAETACQPRGERRAAGQSEERRLVNAERESVPGATPRTD